MIGCRSFLRPFSNFFPKFFSKNFPEFFLSKVLTGIGSSLNGTAEALWSPMSWRGRSPGSARPCSSGRGVLSNLLILLILCGALTAKTTVSTTADERIVGFAISYRGPLSLFPRGRGFLARASLSALSR